MFGEVVTSLLEKMVASNCQGQFYQGSTRDIGCMELWKTMVMLKYHRRSCQGAWYKELPVAMESRKYQRQLLHGIDNGYGDMELLQAIVAREYQGNWLQVWQWSQGSAKGNGCKELPETIVSRNWKRQNYQRFARGNGCMELIIAIRNCCVEMVTRGNDSNRVVAMRNQNRK